MVVFKRRQVVVLALILMIVVAGYLQYSYRKSSITVSGKDSGKIGEAVYVENNDETSLLNQKDKNTGKDTNTGKDGVKDNKDIKDNKDNKSKDGKTTSKAVSASKQANDFFAQAKLDKEITRSKDTDALKAITEDDNATKEAKAKAYDQMVKIIGNNEKEMRMEALIKGKGIEEAVVLFGDDGSLDVVVKAPSLTPALTTQIADIVSRQANVPMDKITVRNVF